MVSSLNDNCKVADRPSALLAYPSSALLASIVSSAGIVTAS